MIEIAFLSFSLLVPTLLAWSVARKVNSSLLPILIFFAGIFFLTLLSLLNSDYSFTGGGDDYDYYQASLVKLNDFSSWFNLGMFRGKFEQSGYPLILTWINQIVGDSLYLRKSLNVIFFLLLSIVWFEIGIMFGGRRVAYIFSISLLLGTPLWFYWIYLLKDMAIILLQSVFLLGLIRYFSNKNTGVAILLIVLSTLGLIPFRVMLVIVNVLMMSFATILQFRKNRKISNVFLKIILSGMLVVLMGIVTTNVHTLSKLGAAGQFRDLSVDTVGKNIDKYSAIQNSNARSFMFPVLYLIGEVTAFNPNAWHKLDVAWLRGFFVLPWVFAGVPLFIAGILTSPAKQREKIAHPLQQNTNQTMVKKIAEEEKMMKLILAFFIAIYAGIAWLSTDTVRWRMPVFPVMAGLAGWGWANLKSANRIGLIFAWSLTLSLFAAIYYFLIK